MSVAAVVGERLSPGQQRLLREGGRRLRPATLVLHLDGPLDRRRLRSAIERLEEEHAVLRTVFAPAVDGAAAPAAGAGREPELYRGTALRCRLEAAQEGQRLVLEVSPLCADAGSLGLLAVELAGRYAGAAGAADWEPLDYANFAAWHHDLLTGEHAAKGRDHWRRALSGAAPALPLAADPEAPAGRIRAAVPVATAAAVARLAATRDAEVWMVASAAWQCLAARLAGSADTLVHHVLPGRDHEELRDAIGLLAHVVPVPGRFAAALRFEEFLGAAAESLRAARDWQEYAVAAEVPPPVLAFEHHLLPAPRQAGGVRFTVEWLDGATVDAALSLTVAEAADGALSADLRWSAGVMTSADGRGLMRTYLQLLAAAAADPQAPVGRLELLDPVQRHAVVIEANDTRRARAAADSLLRRFASQVARRPGESAVLCGGEAMSFAELDRRSRRLARRLRDLGAGPEVPVAVLLEREAALIVTLVAVLRAGAPLLPLDPAHPAARRAEMLAVGRAAVLVRRRGTADGAELPAGIREIDPAEAETEEAKTAATEAADGTEAAAGEWPEPAPENLAYVLFTSGSTGEPKGVMVELRSLLNLADALEEAVYRPLGGAAVVACNAPFTFDASAQQWLQLTAGRTLVLLTEEERLDPARMLEVLRHHRVDLFDCTPSHLRLLLDAGWLRRPEDRAVALVGGEALEAGLWRELGDGAPPAFNVYGPTECTVDATLQPVRGDRPGLGGPLANVRLHVVDHDLRLVPFGVAGELCIAGAGVGRGYRARPALTAAAFVPDPFAGLDDEPGARLYRTGDRVRRRRDGGLEFLGRIDHQVKLRGYRIELGEIERRLVAFEEVAEAVVALRQEADGPQRLVAYVTLDAGAARSEIEARLAERLARVLPAYMLPEAWVVLDELPLNRHGKVDRRALPKPGPQRRTVAYLAPRTPLEGVVAGIWSEVLAGQPVGAADDFFDLGGHSLLAVQVVSRVREVLGVEVAVRLLFEEPRLAGFAASVERVRAPQGEAVPPLVRVPRDGELPLSHSQERLWFLDRLDPGGAEYNVTAAYRLRGPLRPEVLAAALSAVVERHEVLRSTFVERDGVPAQRIAPPAPLPLPVVDLAALPTEAGQRAARRLVRRELATPFDLARGPLMRARLLRFDDGDHAVTLCLHHAVADGWSMRLVRHETAVLYDALAAGRSSPLPPLEIQYADYAAWQRGWLRGEVLERQMDFWRRQLAGAPAQLELPTDRPRPPLSRHRGELLPWGGEGGAPGPDFDRVATFARRHGATPFVVLLAAFQALLARYCGQDDVVVGTPIAGRTRLEVEPLIGFFANTLALRATVDGGRGFEALVAQMRERLLDAHAHQELPFEKLVGELAPERSLDRSPIFQVMFLHQTRGAEAGDGRLGGQVELSALGDDGSAAAFDLTFATYETTGALSGAVELDRDLFDGTTVHRLTRHYRALLGAALDDPQAPLARLPLLAAAERRQVATEWPEGPWLGDEPDGADWLRALDRWAAQRPDQPAVECRGGAPVTYRGLQDGVHRLARYLAGLGVGPETGVALFFDRSPLAVTALLGVVAAGGFYVPLDDAMPARRRQAAVATAGARLLLTERASAGRLGERRALEADGVRVVVLDEAETRAALDAVDSQAPLAGAPAECLAYVIFTSGSTGAPKGVGVPRVCLDVYAATAARFFALGGEDRLLQFSSLTFDASVEEIFGTLVAGSTLVLRDESMLTSAAGFLDSCGALGITVLDLPTAYWHQLAGEVAAGTAALPESVRGTIVAGERALPERCEAWLEAAPGALLWNVYGPTETTVVVSGCAVELPSQEQRERRRSSGAAAGEVSIGRPVRGARLYVVDRHHDPQPAGVAGELWIGGAGVARGYVGEPARTAERFVPDPFGPPGGRLYRSGDRVRWRVGGDLEFLGRLDRQLKVRGFRIEPGEVESVLVTHPAVSRAAVDGWQGSLAAWVEARPGAALPALDALRRWLAERLPAYMVPAHVVGLEALPLTPSGKVDRRSLPAPVAQRPEAMAYLAPRGPLEELVAQVWSELLGVDRIGAEDDFFALGGHSLLATRVVSRLRAALGVDIAVRRVFEAPTVRALAAAAGSAPAAAAAGSPLLTLRDGDGVPLVLVHAAVGTVAPYLPLVGHLAPGYPVYGLRAVGLESGEEPLADAGAMADLYAAELRRRLPGAAYRLAGWSMGGLVALETARRLRAAGDAVDAVVLLDSHLPDPQEGDGEGGEVELLAELGRHLGVPVDRLGVRAADLGGLDRPMLLRRLVDAALEAGLLPGGIGAADVERMYAVFRANLHAFNHFRPQPYSGAVTLLRARDNATANAPERWTGTADVDVVDVAGDHFTLIDASHAAGLARALERALGRAPGPSRGGRQSRTGDRP